MENEKKIQENVEKDIKEVKIVDFLEVYLERGINDGYITTRINEEIKSLLDGIIEQEVTNAVVKWKREINFDLIREDIKEFIEQKLNNLTQYRVSK